MSTVPWLNCLTVGCLPTRTRRTQVQALIYEIAGHERLGFKVGSTSKEAQKYLASAGPNCAEVMAPFVHEKPGHRFR